MASDFHSVGRRNDFSQRFRDEGEFNNRHNLNYQSDNPASDKRVPRDLDTAHLYLNVTNLQRSCKRLDYLRKEIERKQKKKAQKEKKKKCLLVDSKKFIEKKEEYRELYNEILDQRDEVDGLFDQSGRPPDHDEGNHDRVSIASDGYQYKRRPNYPKLGKEECEKCQQKNRKIWELEADIDKLSGENTELEKNNTELNDLCSFLQSRIPSLEQEKRRIEEELKRAVAINYQLISRLEYERKAKEESLLRLSSMASNNNPNIPEVSDPYRPTKLSEQFSELYDNEWADAFHELGNSLSDKEDKEIISYLLDIVLEIHSVCSELSSSKLRTIEEAFVKPSVPSERTKVPSEIITTIKDGIKSMAPELLEYVKKNVFDHLKTKFSEEPLASCLQSGNVKIYIDKCTEVCWHMSAHDPQLFIEEGRSPDGSFDSNKHREYTQNGPYEEFVVWPVLYLYRGGPMLSNGVAQGTKDMKSSSRASNKLRDNNTTFADPCGTNRPTKLSEQFSELYDNEWADAFAELVKHLNSGDDKEIVSYLKDIVLEIHSVCSDISSSKLKSIEKAFVEPSFPSEETKIPSEIFKTIKDGLKSMAPKLLERIRERVLERLEAKFSAEPVVGCLQSINVKRYIDKCTEVCWYMSVQDPQMVMDGSESPDGKFDSNKHREFTRKGPYEEFVVWPVLYLYREGQILSKGVAQGAKTMSGQQ